MSIPFDPVVLAVGHVAVNSAWFETAIAGFCAALANSEDVRKRINGQNYQHVRGVIDIYVPTLPDDLRQRVIETLAGCDAAWAARNTILHGVWVVGAEGYGVHKPRRGNKAGTVAAMTPADIYAVAAEFRRLQFFELTGHTRAVMNVHRASQGLDLITGPIATRFDID